MTSSSGRLAVRLLAEGAAICAGVFMALLADEWRSARSEREEARAGLELILGDLHADSLAFERQRRESRSQAEAAAWLMTVWNSQGPPRDSVENALFKLGVGNTLEISRSAFEGLRDSNRLRFVENESLRSGIKSYYETRQIMLSKFYDLVLAQQFRLEFLTMPPYVENRAGSGSRGLWPANESVRLRQPWTAISADPQMHSDVIWLGRMRDVYEGRLKTAVDVGAALAQDIRAELEGR